MTDIDEIMSRLEQQALEIARHAKLFKRFAADEGEREMALAMLRDSIGGLTFWMDEFEKAVRK